MELVHERAIGLVDDSGTGYDCLRVYAYEQPGGTWAGILEFLRADRAGAVRGARETTQSNLDGVAYWATGLETIYLEGALARAIRRPIDTPATSAGVMSAGRGGRRVARIEVETTDVQLPLRVMATRTLVRGFRRRIHDSGGITYEGPCREAAYAFIVEFGSDNAAAIVANVLWTELRDAAGVLVEGVHVANNHAALKAALLSVTADRLAG